MCTVLGYTVHARFFARPNGEGATGASIIYQRVCDTIFVNLFAEWSIAWQGIGVVQHDTGYVSFAGVSMVQFLLIRS